MSSYEGTQATAAGTDLWRVQLATGELRVMSLDALDDAFQAGVIGEATLVLPPGAMSWTRLGDAAGLDSPPAEPVAPSIAPMAVSVSAPPQAAFFAPPAALEAAPLADLDLEPDAFKPKRGRVFAGIGVAVMLAAGLGFGATRLSALASTSASASNALQADTKAAAVAPPPAAVDVPPAAPGKTLTDDQKQKLADADKAREAREAQKKKDRPAPPARRNPRAKTTTPFVNGGSKYDPLNGAL